VFWEAIADGLSSEDADVAAGVSSAVGTRWLREGGGMPTVSPAPLSSRFLSDQLLAGWDTIKPATEAGAQLADPDLRVRLA
jgi:hypothetical protein